MATLYITGSNFIPYKKMKEERYRAFGGINTKVSQYLNGPMEFLSLENYDFQTPGSLTERWGSTQYFGASLTAKVNGLYEFTQTSGASYFYAVAGGTLGLAFNGGFSAIFSGSTVGASFFATLGTFTSGISIGNFDFDFDTLQNNAFFANGKNFFKSTGSSILFFGLPRFQCDNGTFNGFAHGNTGAAEGFTGYYYYQCAFVNSYGQAGAPSYAYRGSTNFGGSIVYVNDILGQGQTSVTMNVSGYRQTFNGLLAPPNTDITGIAFFRTQGFGTSLSIPDINSADYTLRGVVGISSLSFSATFVDVSPDIGPTFMNKDILPFNWYTYGTSNFTSNLYPYIMEAEAGTGVTLIPKMIETHDNRLFIAGMSTSLSTFFFSEFNEPEHFEADFGFEVRTNDGSGISALKEYNGNLMVFKQSSFFQLSTAADDFANWVLTNVSTEYGCLSNRAVATYANLLVFLDTKGVIQFNGSNIEILSTKVDPIFQRMNVPAAMNTAQLIYDKQRNEVHCNIPVDGATMNNLTVVYDIIAKVWTTYSGYKPAVSAIAQGQLSNRQVFYGGYSGLVSYFGSSFTTDNGVAFTTIIKSGFLTDLGNSTQKVFRRLWLDNSPLGASAFIDVRLYQDYGASIIVGATMPLAPFQNRIDFGVSAKSLSVEFVKDSNFRMALHGFSIAYRFQRNV